MGRGRGGGGADGYSQEESETLAQIDVDTETQAIRDMKVSIDENSQKYINAVYEIGELQSTIKLIEQGVSEEDIIKGFPIGNSLTFKGSVDSNGKLVEGQILDENGDICDDKFSIDSKKAIEKLNEESNLESDFNKDKKVNFYFGNDKCWIITRVISIL